MNRIKPSLVFSAFDESIKYRPKIVITGHFNSGKTEFIRSASEIPVITTEKTITDYRTYHKTKTTVALDFGRMSIDENTTLMLFGTPGLARYDFMWDILSNNMRGFIVMVDSSDRGQIEATSDILDYFRRLSGVPYIIVANRQDEYEAVTPDELKSIAGLAPEEIVIPCVAVDRRSVSEAIKELVNIIV